MSSFKIATVSAPIDVDPRVNAATAIQLMKEAAEAGTRLIHFPEGALSGYVKSQITSWDDVDWETTRAGISEIAEQARALNIWVVIGCNHELTAPNLPHNSLFVISDRGEISARYDKRLCSFTELNGWYTPGKDPLVFELDGLRFGCALCIEVQFYEVFEEYRTLDVDCVLLSSYSDDPQFEISARAHAGLNTFWISHSVPCNTNNPVGSCIIGPDGVIQAQTSPGKKDIAVSEISPDDQKWETPLKKAKVWRKKVRNDDVYKDHQTNDPRSRNKTTL